MKQLKVVLFAMLPTIIILALLEFIASFISPKSSVFWENPMMLQYPVEQFDPTITRERMHFSDDPNRPVRYVPDPLRWYRLEPEQTIPDSGYLFIHLGDSSTKGWGLRNWYYSYPDALNEMLPDSIRSINLGVPGYTSLQGLKYAEEIIPEYHDRMVGISLYFGNNDATENGGPDSLKLAASQQRGPLISINRWLEIHLALYRVMRSGYSSFRDIKNTHPRVNPSEFEHNLRSIITLADSFDIPIILVRPPVRLSWPPGHLTHLRPLASELKNQWVLKELNRTEFLYQIGLNEFRISDASHVFLQKAVEYDWVMSRIKRDWLAVLDKLESEGVPVIHLPEVFIEAEDYAFVDYCHPSAAVHAQIAQQIAYRLGYEK